MALAIPVALGLIALAGAATRAPRSDPSGTPPDEAPNGATSPSSTADDATPASPPSSTADDATPGSPSSSTGPVRQIKPRPFVVQPATVITRPKAAELPIVRDVRVWRDPFGRGVLTTVDVRAWNARAQAASDATASKVPGRWSFAHRAPSELPAWNVPAGYRPLPPLSAPGQQLEPDFGHPPPSSADAHRYGRWMPRSEYLAIATLMRKDDRAARGGKIPPEVPGKLIAASHVAQLVQVLKIRAADPSRRADQLDYRKAIARLDPQLLTVADVLRMPGVVTVVDMGHRPAGLNWNVDDPFWRIQAGILALYEGTRRADGQPWWGGQADPLAVRGTDTPSQQPSETSATWPHGGRQSSSWWAALLSDGTVIPYVVHADPGDVMDSVHDAVGFYGIGRLAILADVLPWLLQVVQLVLSAFGAGGLVSGIGATVIKAIRPILANVDRYVQQAADTATLSVTRAPSES